MDSVSRHEPNLTAFEIATALGGARPNSNGWMARCPAHADRHPSLSIAQKDGIILVNCKAHCSQDAVIDALKQRGLWPRRGNESGMTRRLPKAAPASVPVNYVPQPPDDDARKAALRFADGLIKDGFELKNLFPYQDLKGQTIYWRFRLQREREKHIRPIWWDGTKWVLKEPPAPAGGKILYGLAAIFRNPGAMVWIVEGEGKVDALGKLSLTSVTSGSSATANGADWKPLEGRHCRIWPDHDNPGKKYGSEVMKKLAEVGAILDGIVDTDQLGLDEGGDVSDWLRVNPGATAEAVLALPTVETVCSQDVKEGEWLNPIPLDVIKGEPIPKGIFTGPVGDMINAVSEFTETPYELAASFAIAVLATVTQKVFSVQVKPLYIEPLSIWTLCALPSGNRKTTVLQHMTAPLIDVERRMLELAKPDIARRSSERKTSEAKITAMRTKAARMNEDSEYKAMAATIARLESELPDIPAPPRLLAQDITPEKLGTLMAASGERIANISDEGGIFDILGGRYSNGILNLDLFLQAHAGSPVRIDRQSRGPIAMDSPALTMAIAPQPLVLSELTHTPAFRGRGLLGRFLYLMPLSNLGRRTHNTALISEQVIEKYKQAIEALADRGPGLGCGVKEPPRILHLSSGAFESWHKFQLEVERDMAPSGEFEYLQDWAGKLPGAVARLAGLFHCADHAFGQPEKHHVSPDTMSRAISLGATLATHALAAFDMMGQDAGAKSARRIVEWIIKTRADTFTLREVYQVMRGYFKTVDAMRPGLNVLADHSIIRECDLKQRSVGRPSRKYVVNPKVFGSEQ